MEKFKDIRSKMQALSASKDYEYAHIKADELLQEACLAAAVEKWTHKDVDVILKHYKAVTKFYA